MAVVVVIVIVIITVTLIVIVAMPWPLTLWPGYRRINKNKRIMLIINPTTPTTAAPHRMARL